MLCKQLQNLTHANNMAYDLFSLTFQNFTYHMNVLKPGNEYACDFTELDMLLGLNLVQICAHPMRIWPQSGYS